MPEELIDESIGTKIQLNEYETGLPKNRRHNKVVIDSSPTFGYRDGEALWYHKNGNLKQKIPYKEGSPHGIQEMYHENGQLKKRGRHGGPPVQGYNVGKGFRVGIWEFWDEDGTKLIPKKYEYDE